MDQPISVSQTLLSGIHHLQELGCFDQALQLARRLVRLENLPAQHRGEAWLQIAYMLQYDEPLGETIHAALQATRLIPYDARAWKCALENLLRDPLSSMKYLRRCAKKLRDLLPDEPETYFLYAQVCLRAGKERQALRLLLKVGEMPNLCPNLLVRVAIKLAELGKPRRALRLIRTSRFRYPENLELEAAYFTCRQLMEESRESTIPFPESEVAMPSETVRSLEEGTILRLDRSFQTQNHLRRFGTRRF
jgi:tetratricopeptide (TPR) repeat protein